MYVTKCPIHNVSVSFLFGASIHKHLIILLMSIFRSGGLTPKSQFSFDEAGTGKASPISGPQLIERLTSLEGQQSAVRDRRNKYQLRRTQDDWRTRTQPVTLLEIQEADRYTNCYIMLTYQCNFRPPGTSLYKVNFYTVKHV